MGSDGAVGLVSHGLGRWRAPDYKQRTHRRRLGQTSSTRSLQDLCDFRDSVPCVQAGAGRGAEIDAHTAVVRFNDAPTLGAHLTMAARVRPARWSVRVAGGCDRESQSLEPERERLAVGESGL